MKAVKPKFFVILKFLIGWPFSLLAFFVIGNIIYEKKGSVINNIHNVNALLLIGGVLAFFCFFFIRGLIWKLILRANGKKIPAKECIYLWAQAEIKRFIPGFIWVFIGKTLLFQQHGIDKRTVFSSIMVEVQFIFLGNLFLSLLAIPFLAQDTFILKNVTHAATISLLFFTFLGFLYLFQPFFRSLFRNRFIRWKKTAAWTVAQRILPNFSLRTNIVLFCVSSAASFLFGLGTFLTISSVVALDPYNIREFIGFFTFSYLVGYLFLIAPMGLGVREGAITIGLSSVMPIASAAFASIFSRVILIASELLFFLSIYLWSHAKSKYINLTEKNIALHIHLTVLSVFFIIFSIYFITINFLRYENFYTGRFDLGNMDQTVWNTLNGRIFQTSSDGIGIISRLSVHADFMLIFLAPFYLIWPDARMLLLLQTVIVGLGVFFVYLISLHYTRSRNISLAFGISYLFNPFVHHTILYDFHAVTLATTLLLAAYYFFLKKKYWNFVVFAILAAITKEQVWLIAALFGLVDLMRNLKAEKTRKLISIALFIIPLCIFVYIVWVAIPGLRGSNHFAISYYSDFGSSPTEIVQNIMFSPGKTLETFLREDRTLYLFRLFSPVGFLALLSPITLIFAVPDLLINMLSSNEQLRHVYYQYSTNLTPFIFISAIVGLKKALTKIKSIPSYALITYLLFWTFFSAYQFGPLPGARFPNLAMIASPQKNKEFINKHLATIPSTNSVSATNNLGSHLSQREELYSLPFAVGQADFVAILLDRGTGKETFEKQKELASILKEDKQYTLIVEKDSFFLFKKSPI